MRVAGRIALILLEGEVRNVCVGRGDDAPADECAVRCALRADDFERTELLEDGTELGTGAQELLAEEAAAQRMIRMRGEDENAAPGLDAPDKRCMPVHV